MKLILILALVILPLTGCSVPVLEPDVKEPVVEELEPTEPEPAEEPTVVKPADEPVVEPEQPAEINDKEVEVAEKDEDKDKDRIIVEPPPPAPEFIPLFSSARLDLSSSTPEEIIIRILYFDEGGKPYHWQSSPEALLGGMTNVEIWKGIPTEEERKESRQRDEEYYESFVLLGIINQEYSYIRSSEEVLVIPTSSLSPYDGDKVTLRVYIDIVNWGTSFDGKDGSRGLGLNYLETTLQKNW